jgi:acetylornithine deacetylase/succinyl-diaminopimelate desuccinylase-like protein
MHRLWMLLLTLPLAANDEIAARPGVRKALAYLEANHARHVDKQIEIAGIPAPTFHEAERARFMEKEFRRVGLADVSIDEQGNVLGWRRGPSDRIFVVAAHLDISFAVGVDTKVRREGTRLHAPGIGDDSRGLAASLAIVEAMNEARLETRRTILFVANVGEEGLGDLIGMKHIFGKSSYRSRIDGFISIDGSDPARIVNGGNGVKRYGVSIKGPGGHSYGNFGRPNAAHALGRIIARLASFEVPSKPKTTFNVGKIGGGTTVNAIAEEATMEVDMRSESPAELDKLEARFLEAVRLGTGEENARWAASGHTVKAETKLIGNRPAGETARDSPLVRAAMWSSRTTGHTPSLMFSSTDANHPISLGVPAVTMGGGGRGDNAHSLKEWHDPTEGWKGPQTVLLTILAFDAETAR